MHLTNLLIDHQLFHLFFHDFFFFKSSKSDFNILMFNRSPMSKIRIQTEIFIQFQIQFYIQSSDAQGFDFFFFCKTY